MKYELPATDADDTRLMHAAAVAFLAMATVAALYFGRDVMIPAAIAILLAFILGPAVTLVRRLLPLSVAVILVVLGAGIIIGLIAALVMSQLAEVANSLTTYQANLTQKIRDIRDLSQGSGILSRFLEMVASVASNAAPPGAAPAQIVRVEAGASDFEGILAFVAPLLHPVLTVGIVGVLVVFILLDRDHLSDQFVRLFGAGDVHATSAAIEDAGGRVARVLTLQLLTNFGFALLVGGGLFALELPNAILWGLLAGGLRFIPYVGTLLGALLPTLIAFAVMPGWGKPFLVLGWIIACDLVIGNFIEPMLFSGSTGVTPLALIMSAVFWAALWGPIGLLLSTPLAICMFVLGRHVPRLGFLRILMGAAPVLEPYQQVYRRLMRNAVVDAATVVLSEIEEKGPERGLDSGIGRMLALAEADRARDRLSAAQADVIVEGTDEMLEIIAADASEDVAKAPAQQAGTPGDVLLRCVGGRGGIDDAAALVVAFALRQAGANAASRRRGEPGADDATAALTFDLICYASPPSELIRRYTSRKLKSGSTGGQTRHLVIDYGEDVSGLSAGSVDTRAGDIAALVRLTMQDAVAARSQS
jgi:predicted PurR-regulated permease PerM